MSDTISAQQFQEADGVEDWRVLGRFACAHFATNDFATGKQLVDAISELAEKANHHPDIDLRYGFVAVRMTSHDVGGLSQRDVDLARRISEAAASLGIDAAPEAVELP